MSTKQSQVVEPKEFIDLSDYEFGGDSETVDKKYAVITAYRRKASIYHAAQAGRVARETIYRWLERDPAFANALRDSAEDSADIMETSVYERALGRNGHKADSLLAMFWLKAKRPQFRDKLAVDVVTIQNQVKEFMAQLLNTHTVSSDRANSSDASNVKKEPLLLTSIATSTSDNEQS
jgi:hypothetical protein